MSGAGGRQAGGGTPDGRTRWTAPGWIVASLAAGIIAAAVVLLPGFITESSQGESPDRSLGAAGLPLLLVVTAALVPAVPLVFGPWVERVSTIVTAIVLLLWCLVGLASVGLYFLPSAVLMLIAAALNIVRRRSS
ncbi:hypothetical protein HDA32_004098 [Spinactinospora alkalitolerans]|uniref:Uncharacterized protein n=1 Tax=Spinactinospora alkalitolerans TaxID=687207 RepID=A0A852TYG8_9ACTN|nr:hypothetical protein [Spinactinospora alkalitolerans]NYE48978.1 hypothetical protein [Spinactinospora alkalitolerans]